MKKSIAQSCRRTVLSALTACGGSTSSSDSSAAANTGDSDKVITVGATPTPHAEILNAAKDALEAEGYTLKVVEFTDYVQPNTALVDGDLDANYFQHTPYLNNFNKENGTDLAAAFDMHYEPFGIYAGKTASIEELADGASVAIPNDGSQRDPRAASASGRRPHQAEGRHRPRPPTRPSSTSPRTRRTSTFRRSPQSSCRVRSLTSTSQSSTATTHFRLT